MSRVVALLILAALIGSQASSSPVVVGEFNPTLTVRQSSEPHHFEAEGQIPVVMRFGTISVPKTQWHIGLHGHAYRQMTYLYPSYRSYAIRACSYTVYGPSRIYLYQLQSPAGAIVRVISSVQNNEESTGEETQETVQEQAAAQIEAEDINSEDQSEDVSQYNVIKVSRAYEIPRVALALKVVTRRNWRTIRSAPLVRCLERWERGVYRFRFYFHGVAQWFEYSHNSRYESVAEELEEPSSQLRVEENVEAPPQSQEESEEVDDSEDDYLARTQPIFTVANHGQYSRYSVSSFRRHPGYRQIVAQFVEHFGRFDESWIAHIRYRSHSSNHYFLIQVRFVPFLVDVDLEAHYYGSTEKASILKIDEKVFNGKDNRKYFNSWNEIEDFNSYRAFAETNAFVLSHFTYLRFYKVTAAYSALYKKGRYVRLVYESENGFFSSQTRNGENQFNMIVYIVEGKFYIDRNDFHATNTYSFGKTDWLSLFVRVEDVNTHADYHRIVKFFMTNHLEFWHAHRVEEINFKDGLHVVKFRNPSNLVKLDEKLAVLQVDQGAVKLLNHHEWQPLNEASIQHSKAFDYIHAKYDISVPLFVSRHRSPHGQHFEASYLNEQEVYSKVYLSYSESEDVFSEDEWRGIAYGENSGDVPLPTNAEDSVVQFVLREEPSIVAVIEVRPISRYVYECVAVSRGNRWRLTLNWVRGSWVLNHRAPIHDGYFTVSGYPSVHTASCTGYLARLYPVVFRNNWLYTSIQVKNIGYFVYSRVIYAVGSHAYQGVIRTTHGVENSHTLISWDRVRHVVPLNDYGYGHSINWNYGYDNKYFFNYEPRVVVQQQTVTIEVIEKSQDILCSYFDDNGECLSCYGDYYANNDGECVRIEDECEYWKVSGVCHRCAYGWAVDAHGVCQLEKDSRYISAY